MTSAPVAPEPTPDVAPVLAVRGLTIGYRGHPPLLRDWDATFHGGRTVAVTGPSGRGKSTLLYVLGLMMAPRSGQVLLDGVRADALRDHERAALRAHRFGFVFQDAALDPTRTVLDNVVEAALYRGASRTRAADDARALLERFGVELRAGHRPTQVSGGQAQRIALCRALLGDPRVVLADEPTGNLDPASARVVVAALREHAARGAAVVVVTHDEAVAQACSDRVRL